MQKQLFQPKQITRKLLACLQRRARDIIEQRFGIGKFSECKTLEAIGETYGITRERVRQIEEAALKRIRQAPVFASLQDAFGILKTEIESYGGVVCEKVFLNSLAKDSQAKNRIYFLLMLGNDFERLREDDAFHHRWTTDKGKASLSQEALKKLHQELTSRDLLSEDEIITRLAGHVENISSESPEPRIVRSWFDFSRLISQNHFGEWGIISSPYIRPRGVRDLAYLVMQKHGSPMHFTEVTKAISNIKSLNRSAHAQTVHNELIKDDRFVLVGRGLYAIKEWDYASGTVRDVIKGILASNPLKKDEIIHRVLKEREVKENTILINLQNRRYFKKHSDETYSAI